MENNKLPFESFLGIKTFKYRIVTDKYAGFEIQVWSIFWPFWHQPYINTNISIEQAIKYIQRDFDNRNFKSKIVVK